MERATIVLCITGAYLVLNLIIGVMAGSKSSSSSLGYIAGDRALGPVLMYFITGATIFSAFAFLGAPGWAYERGGASYYILAYGILGFVPFYFLGPRAARLGRQHGYVTQAEMVAHRYRMPAIAGLMAVISLVAFLPYLALQMKGAGLVLESLSGGRISRPLGAAIVYAVVMLYVLKSGVLGVGWTNVFQGLFMMAMAWVIGLWLPQHLYGGVGEMFERIAAQRPELLSPPGLTKSGSPLPWSEYSSMVLVHVVGFSCWPHLFMKAFTARDDRTLQRTVVLYPTFMIFLVPILLMGYAAVLQPDRPADADQVLPHLLMRLDLPAVLVGLFCAGALAASMSTGDALAHAAASIVVRDGLVSAGGARFSADGERRAIRVTVVLVMLLAYAIAVFYGDSVVSLLVFAYGPITQLAPALVATLCSRRATGPGVLAGLVAGIAVTLLFDIGRALPEPVDLRPFAIHAGLYGLAANVLALLVVSSLTRSSGPALGQGALVGRVPGAQTPG